MSSQFEQIFYDLNMSSDNEYQKDDEIFNLSQQQEKQLESNEMNLFQNNDYQQAYDNQQIQQDQFLMQNNEIMETQNLRQQQQIQIQQQEQQEQNKSQKISVTLLNAHDNSKMQKMYQSPLGSQQINLEDLISIFDTQFRQLVQVYYYDPINHDELLINQENNMVELNKLPENVYFKIYLRQNIEIQNEQQQQLKVEEQEKSLSQSYSSQQNSSSNQFSHQSCIQSKKQQKQQKSQIKRVKERSIQDVTEKVQQYQNLQDNGIYLPQTQSYRRLKLVECAKMVGISKKSLDDYKLQIKKARQNGFDFQKYEDAMFGEIRKFNKQYLLIQQEQTNNEQTENQSQQQEDADYLL